VFIWGGRGGFSIWGKGLFFNMFVWAYPLVTWLDGKSPIYFVEYPATFEDTGGKLAL